MALASAQGTGTTTGPYYPVVNTLISLNDPFIYSQCAQSLQIQMPRINQLFNTACLGWTDQNLVNAYPFIVWIIFQYEFIKVLR